MTALKPIENMTGVKPIASERYPLGTICAHPTCTNTDVTAHHIFPRGKVKGDSWFVQLNDKAKGEVWSGPIIPHVVPLCGSGTTGHHGDVEEHRGWIKLEVDTFIWYEMVEGAWEEIGALNPQPGYGDGKPKRKKAAATKQEKRAKPNFTIKAPVGEDNVIPELVEDACVIVPILFGAPKLATDYQGTHVALAEFVKNHREELRKGRKKFGKKS